MKITREQEAKLPDFPDHKSAREYFKALYGSNFVLTLSEEIDGVKWYFYHLILNKETYLNEREKIQKKGHLHDARDFLNSYQEVQVSEEGIIHVVY